MPDDERLKERCEMARVWFIRQHFVDRSSGIKETCERLGLKPEHLGLTERER